MTGPLGVEGHSRWRKCDLSLAPGGQKGLPVAQGISVREFARRDGCSHTLVSRAVKAGHLVAFADGSLDPDLVGTGWRKENRDRGNKAAALETVATPLTATGETPAQAAERIVAAGGADMDLAEAERLKENYLALLRQLEYETKAGRLVDAEEYERRAFTAARVERDAWLNWPQRVAAEMAAELSLDAVTLAVTLERYVRHHLDDLARRTLEAAS